MEVGVKLRDNLSRYLEVVREGHEVTVTDHGKAVARLIPLDTPRTINRLVAEGIVTPAQPNKLASTAGARPRG